MIALSAHCGNEFMGGEFVLLFYQTAVAMTLVVIMNASALDNNLLTFITSVLSRLPVDFFLTCCLTVDL